MPPRALRVARYLRVSTRDQNLGLQDDETAAYATQRGWTVTGTYEDALSGASTNRPGLDQLLKDARRGRFDVVLCWKSDRLFRSLAHFVSTVHALGEMGIAFASATEPIDSSSAAGRLVMNLMATLAEFERSLIRERTSAGIRAARARGVRVGRPKVDLDLDLAIEMRTAGKSYKAIATNLGVSVGLIHKALTAAVQKTSADRAPKRPTFRGSTRSTGDLQEPVG